jgi:hypothetical protein
VDGRASWAASPGFHTGKLKPASVDLRCLSGKQTEDRSRPHLPCIGASIREVFCVRGRGVLEDQEDRDPKRKQGQHDDGPKDECE